MNSKEDSANRHLERRTLARPVHPLLLILVVAAAFAIYWATSFILEENKATTRFGADTWFYTEIADGDALSRLHESQYLGRVFRFHPLTVIAGTAWMNALDWLTNWIVQEHVLRAMFALVGALGGYAAMSGFAAVMLRRHVAFWGAIYAVSLAVWYFSSIEESKIVSATLATTYIALYLHLRENWTQRNAISLTVVLFLACMNEIVAGFLVVIPVVDTLVRHGIDFLRGRWILLHASIGPLALGILEWIARSRFDAANQHPEGGTHFSMLFWYITQNDYNFAAVYAFVVRWIFFSIGAPEAKVYFANPSIGYGGDFYPSTLLYFYSPAAAAVAILFLTLLAATFLPRFRAKMTRDAGGIMVALGAYVLVRGAFFFLLLPQEYMLFASSVTFAILLLVAIPFAKSSFPRKRILLALFATALFLANGAFMLAPQP
jgi:hypothetical protein